MLSMINPYSEASFLEFFMLLMERLLLFFKGQSLELVSDERQLLLLCFVSLSCSLIGVFLVLRKMTLLVNALTHTSLFGIVSVYLWSYFWVGAFPSSLSIPLLLASGLISALLTTLTTDGLGHFFKLQKDASIGLVFSLYFSLGITLLSLFSKNSHLGTELITGNIDIVNAQDVSLMESIFIVNSVLILLLYRALKFSTFDELGARLSGFSPYWIHFVLMLMTSVTCMGALRSVGALPLLVFLTLPPICARFMTNRLGAVIAYSVMISLGGSLIGVAFSRHLYTFLGFGLSTSGLLSAFFSLFLAVCVAGFYLLPRIRIFQKKKHLQETAPLGID